jgi:aldehyde:ferredoxin oxidoreductase
MGSTIACAMELTEAGLLPGGPRFGDADALLRLIADTVERRGLGEELALGSRSLAAGRGAPELSMSVKGLEFPAYDGRALQGMGLAYATNNRGACHLRGYMVSPEVLGIPVKMDPQATEGKAAMLKAFQDLTGVVDSSGLCLFTTFAWGLGDIQPQIQAACEGDWSEERLLQIGERIWNLERQFNLKAGLTRKDDDLPARLKTEPAKSGPAKGLVNGVEKMLPEYYQLRGWNADGVPTSETLGRLGLPA